MRRKLLLAGLALSLGTTEVVADDFGFAFLRRRQAKADPAARAKQLIGTLQADPDADKRKAAAEELRNLDARTFPDIVTALTGALQSDPSVAVRAAAVESLGRIKPVIQSAGLLMEAALVSDPDVKVRESLRSALWLYHLNGYRTAAGTPLTSQTPEPRLAPVTVRTAKQSESAADTNVVFRPITTAVGNPIVFTPTSEPTLAVRRPAPRPQPPKPPAAKPITPPKVNGLPLPEIPLAPPPEAAVPIKATRNF